MKRLRWATVVWALAAAVAAAAATPAPSVPRPSLPAFAGWQKAQQLLSRQPGWGLPPNQAAAMAEFGLQTVERDTYQRGGRSIQIQGLRFSDAAGAYGAFTYYRPANFHAFDLAQPREQAASGDTHILFTRGAWLVEVQMDELTAMTAADMRALAAAMPPVAGVSLTLPTVAYYLPRPQLDASSVRFVEGPAAFAAACSWLPPASVGFDRSAQAVLANYELPLAGAAQLLIIAYPTPQMARTHLAAWQANPAFTVRRSGPLLVLVHGVAAVPALQLAQAVNYDANITQVPPTPVGIEGLPALILGIFLLCGLIISVAVVVGVLTGGVRVMLQRLFPTRFARLQPQGLIRLNLK